MKITEDLASFKKVLNYVRVCIIIHTNLLTGWTDPNFEYEEDDCCNMQTTETEGNGVNVNVTTEAYTSGHLRRRQ